MGETSAKLLQLLSLVSAVWAGCWDDGKTLLAANTTQVLTIDVGGLEREFGVVVPANVEENAPVLFDLHGWGGDAESQLFYLYQLAVEEGFVLVTPGGYEVLQYVNPDLQAELDIFMEEWEGFYFSLKGWNTITSTSPDLRCDLPDNATMCYESCGPDENHICPNKCNYGPCMQDDVMFIDELLDFVEDNFCVDPARLYLSGCSMGAMMSYMLVNQGLADRFAAMVVTGGLPDAYFPDMYGPSIGIPIMHLHGVTDDVILAFDDYEEAGVTFYGGMYRLELDATLSYFAEPNGCEGAEFSANLTIPYNTRNIELNPEAMECSQLIGCTEPVVKCMFDGGHVYPTLGPHITWDFLKEFTREVDVCEAINGMKGSRANMKKACKQAEGCQYQKKKCGRRKCKKIKSEDTCNMVAHCKSVYKADTFRKCAGAD